MPAPPAATAAARVAMLRSLAGLDGVVLAAVSGGADSLAVAATLAYCRPGSGAVVVDHRLQANSAAMAAGAAGACASLGLYPVEVLAVEVGSAGGPEAAARTARYRALAAAALRLGASAVVLGHTRDDQAETVLLGLARGSGARALAGMAPIRGAFRRPFLGLGRDLVRQVCAEAGLVPVADPHNTDPAFARVRARQEVLPAFERALGPGVAAALARTAQLLREDADALDALTPNLADRPSCHELMALPAALRSRALKRWAERASGRAVTSVHVDALRALVEQWSGQGPAALPGLRVRRSGDLLWAEPSR